MKKIYIKPGTETVNVRLFSSVMDNSQGHFGPYSHVAAGGDDPGFADAKEGNFDDFNSEEDIWGGRVQMKDAWER